MSGDHDPAKPQDVLFMAGPTKDGEGVHVVRAHGDQLEAGVVRGVKEGEPINGELVQLKQRPEHKRLFDVEVLLPCDGAASSPRPKAEGPAQVTTDAYRRNWEHLFGSRSKKQLLN
jgi:hypothetical protein